MKFSAKLHPAISPQGIQNFICGKEERGKNYHGLMKLERSSRLSILPPGYQLLTPGINRLYI
jgi:hypothetical protein